MNQTQRPVILIAEADALCEEAKRILHSHAELIYNSMDQSEIKKAMNLCDVFFFRLGLKINSDDLIPDQRCKIIATPVTGLDHIDLNACKENQIHVISLKGEIEFLENIRATAEFTFTLILSLIRKIVPASHDVTMKNFNRNAFIGNELFGKTIGIIGYGRLGKIVSRYAETFGMRVLICEKDTSKLESKSNFHFVNLKTLLNQSDYVSLHVDSNEENKNLVEASFLKEMKSTSFLINTSRGSLIDESALVHALKNGIISGAALDVVNGEPDVNFESELFLYQRIHSNLLVTPHLGGNTYESLQKTECFIANKIIDKLQYA